MGPANAPAHALPPPPENAFGLGALVTAAIDLARAHPLILLPLALLGFLSGGGSSAARFDPATDPWGLVPFYALLGLAALGVLIVIYFAYVVAWLMTTHVASQALQGAPVDVAAAWRHALPLTLRGAWTGLLWLGAVVLGLILLIVPGLIVLAALAPLPVIMSEERLSGQAALRRAWDLSRGHRGALLGLVLLSILTSIVASILLSWVPIVGDRLAGAAGGAASAVLAAAIVVYYRRRLDHTHVPIAAAPSVL